MNRRALLLPLLHTLVEERAGLPAVGPAKAGVGGFQQVQNQAHR